MSLIDVTSAFQGFSQPIAEIIDDIHRRGWDVNKIDIKDGNYVAEGKSPHGESLEAFGRTDATAAANLLVKIMRQEFMRQGSLRDKLGAWDHTSFESQLPQIAQAYAGAPIYEPKAAPSWMELAQDCERRRHIIGTQIAIEYTNDPVPYQDANEMREDVTKKKHIMVTQAYAHHPVWSERQMLDFRTVVDVLGHTVGGADWGWHGTCLAFASLAPMVSESAQKALFTEMLGQTAFGTVYRNWGPQKICFLEDLIEKVQKDENKPGHSGVHPSQSIVPGVLPSVKTFSSVDQQDPNANWQSGIQPLPDNAFLWQRADGIDPLDAQKLSEGLRPLDTGLANLHPAMGQQAVVNALRASILGSRSNPRSHALHYQSIMNLPAGVDDPMAYWDSLEQQREAWNQGQGYAPGSHKQHWAEEQQFKQWVKATNPQLDDGEVQRAAKREMLHMLSEEEERILAQDPGEELTHEQIEHEAYNAIKLRLKAMTKPTVDQKVDFGDDHLFHEASSTSNWIPGQAGKGILTNDGSLHTWNVDTYGEPHHADYAAGLGMYGGRVTNAELERDHTIFFIEPDGQVIGVPFGEQAGAIRARDPGLYFRRDKTSIFHADMDFGDDRLFHEAANPNPKIMWHVAPSDLRQSIEQHGLDWTKGRLGTDYEALGSEPANYLWPLEDQAAEDQARQSANGIPSDLYEVDVSDLPVEKDPVWTEASRVADAIPPERVRRIAKTSTYHADMYPPYLASSLRPIATVSRNASELAEAAREDLLRHKGHGHHFRAKALSLNIPQIGPRQISNAWLHLAPQTSQLGVMEPQVMDTLGHDYGTEGSNRDYFKHERELAAGRDAAGYSHVPLGAFSAGISDLRSGGPGWHPDRTPFKPYAPTPPHQIDWTGQAPTYPDWPEPYWWTSTQEARDQVAQDFDRTVGVNHNRNDVPYQRTSAVLSASGPSPWVIHPTTGERLTGAPGTSLMQHIKQAFGHGSVQDVWNQPYEVGKQ